MSVWKMGEGRKEKEVVARHKSEKRRVCRFFLLPIARALARASLFLSRVHTQPVCCAIPLRFGRHTQTKSLSPDGRVRGRRLQARGGGAQAAARRCAGAVRCVLVCVVGSGGRRWRGGRDPRPLASRIRRLPHCPPSPSPHLQQTSNATPPPNKLLCPSATKTRWCWPSWSA